MMQRSVRVRPADDNSTADDVEHANNSAMFLSRFPYTRALLTAGFSGFVLVVLSGACLVALAAVGVLAAVVGGFVLLRRQIWRPALDHQVAGYPGRP